MKKLFIALLSMFMAVSVFNTLWAGNGQYDFSLRRGETRQTLSPDIFLNPVVRRAYVVAKRIPWVLDSIYCYCHCEAPRPKVGELHNGSNNKC
ncbi:MAG: hypothetical protein D6778_10965, partial [Nitrospirae bacterium]